MYFWLSFVENAGSLYSGNLKAEYDYDLMYGDDLPHSIGYTINGEPGDLCPCSKGTRVDFRFYSSVILGIKIFWSYWQTQSHKVFLILTFCFEINGSD